MNIVALQLARVPEEYRKDCARVVQACFQNGVVLTLPQAYEVWDDHSSERSASWLILPDTLEGIWEELAPREREDETW